MAVTQRTVHSRWAGGLRADVDAGAFTLVADEPETVGGTGTGPQPTEYLLAAIASCFTLAMAFSARRRGIELDPGTAVDVTGTYDGPRFTSFRIEVRTSEPTGAKLDELIAAAERVCYVTQTLKNTPTIEVVTV